MKECKKYEKLLKQLFANQIDKEDEIKLFQHIEHCQHCGDLYKLHQQFSSAALDLPDANSEEYAKIRQNVIRIIRRERALEKISWSQKITDYLGVLFGKPVFAISISAILFLVGFFLHSAISRSQNPSHFGLIQHLKYTAKQNTDLQKVENSPYIFSDVRLRDINGDKVAIGFNVSTHLELIRPKNDPLVKEVLAQAVLNSASLGNRLRAISYSEEIMDSKIKEALIFTMLNDQNLAVRIKAMTSLAKYPSDTEIQDAFIKILKDDKLVQLRLMAIDYLTGHISNEENLEEIVKGMNQAKDTAIKYKLYQQIRN